MGQSQSNINAIGGNDESITGNVGRHERGGGQDDTLPEEKMPTAAGSGMGRRRRLHAAVTNSGGSNTEQVIESRRSNTTLTSRVEGGENLSTLECNGSTTEPRSRSFRQASPDSHATTATRTTGTFREPMMQRIRAASGRMLNGRSNSSGLTPSVSVATVSANPIGTEGIASDETSIPDTDICTNSIVEQETNAPLTPPTVPRLISESRARFDDSPRRNQPDAREVTSPVSPPDHLHSSREVAGPTFIPPASYSPSTALLYSRPVYLRKNSSNSSQDESEWIENNFDVMSDYHNQIFYPLACRDYEWMGRSIETLVLGHALARAPILQLIADDYEADFDAGSYFEFERRRSTASTFAGARRRSTAGSYQSGRRCSLSLSGHMQGGTMASYYNNRSNQAFRRPSDVDRSVQERQGRRCSTANGLQCRRRSSMASSVATPSVSQTGELQRKRADGGPNVLLHIIARECTGKSIFPRGIPEAQKLRRMGGTALFDALDKPSDGMASEVTFLAAAIDLGDWAETHGFLSRLVVRLIGDQSAATASSARLQDPNLPRSAHRFYAGGGRIGLERDAFVLAGGVPVLIRIFREKSFVGQEMAQAYDARYLSEGIVATRFAPCWNEALASLRELVYYLPSLVEGGAILDDGDFLPFLFTLLSHDSCFECAAALIEEMLSFMSQTQQHQPNQSNESGVTASQQLPPLGRSTPASTFYLGNIPDLYKLWRGFNCRQLAHFCRILALLVFEPEDRQLLENPAVLKSQELLQLRRNRTVRAARDSTVDMNQAILLGDDELMKRLLKLLGVMNYAPPLRRFSPYHVMAHFPFVADTLVMLGLNELDCWDEIDRQDRLARTLLEESTSEGTLSELGSIADMLDTLSETLVGSNRQPNQIGNIIHVISAAQQAGVIVGRSRGRRARRQPLSELAPAGDSLGASSSEDAQSPAIGDVSVSIQGLASVASILSDQILVRRLYPTQDLDDIDHVSSADGDIRYEPRHIINTPEDAANSLQFNAMLFGPYQVEVLFVLCTLLGGRRKLDAQDALEQHGIISVLEGMFQRLPWYKGQKQSEADATLPNSLDAANHPNGIHGPGCECTPESALCVQYLRMLHNFCDRDCDNYGGRRLLLSADETMMIHNPKLRLEKVRPGLLTYVISAFIGESDESPYRFWLASCIESFLRGSSPSEQMFVAQSGLLDFLVEEISSDRLHCAGSLQTSFDLLGELGKGNPEVVLRLVSNLDEESFKKLMSVAAANLVDSNVFIRSLLLSLERLSAREGIGQLYLDSTIQHPPTHPWVVGSSRSYLTHSWWDSPSTSLANDESSAEVNNSTEEHPTDWFPSETLAHIDTFATSSVPLISPGLNDAIGHFGWRFTPVGDNLNVNAYQPNTVERLSWFLAANQARLLRDLLVVVDLRNINHENICCLNTAVVIAIFAHRRQQLARLLTELRQMSKIEMEGKPRGIDAVHHDQVVDRAFAQALRYLDLSSQQRENLPGYARRASLTNVVTYSNLGSDSEHHIADRTDVIRNFREVLWFWTEYYTHRGRDRLSLEFSSHIRFQEWNHVVSLLVADDESSTSLVRSPVCLPRSPYQRAASGADSPSRGC